MKETLKQILLKYNIDEEIVNSILENEDFSAYKTQNEVDELIKSSLIDGAVEAELKAQNAKNIKLCKTLIDSSKITYQDGELSGIKEQVREIKKENPYLFETLDTKYTPQSGNDTQNLDTLSDKEYFNLIKKNLGGF